VAKKAGAINTMRWRQKGRAPYRRIILIPMARAADLLRQIRHNLVVSEKPFFRRVLCRKTGTLF